MDGSIADLRREYELEDIQATLSDDILTNNLKRVQVSTNVTSQGLSRDNYICSLHCHFIVDFGGYVSSS